MPNPTFAEKKETLGQAMAQLLLQRGALQEQLAAIITSLNRHEGALALMTEFEAGAESEPAPDPLAEDDPPEVKDDAANPVPTPEEECEPTKPSPS